MAQAFLTEATKAALLDAVRAVEGDSRAEVVIVVRPRSAAYREAPFLGALIAAFVALAFMLYAPWTFNLAWFLVDPALSSLIVGLAIHRSPALVRLLTPRTAREQAVHDAARAAFVDRGVMATRERTGLLLYVSLLERRAEVVADRGILEAVEPTDWGVAVDALRAAVTSGADGARTAERLRALGELLAEVLPVGPDDANELSDVVVTS